jgi:hypothetical protein
MLVWCGTSLLHAQTTVALEVDQAGDVDVEAVLRMGDTVQLVGAGNKSAADGIYDVMGPPENDAGKWFITLVTRRGCAPCARLKADFERDPHLRAFANPRDHKSSWAFFNEYDVDDQAQNWRFKNIVFKGFPTLIIQPPRSKQYGDPTTVVDQITGYDGHGKQLATRIRNSIALYAQKFNVQRNERQPSGHGQAAGHVAAPWEPRPKQDDFPPAYPTPVVPTIPQLPVFPFDQPPAPPTPPAPTIPQGAQVVLVTDGSEDAAELGPLQALVHRLREREKFRLREMAYEEAKATYPVTEADLPAVFVTRDGEIESKILARLLPALQPPTPQKEVVEKVVEVPVEIKGPVEWPDVPWDIFLAILTTGFTPALLIPLGIWAFKVVRALRKRNDQPLLIPDDGVIDRLLERGAPRLEALFERFAQRRHKDQPGQDVHS